MQSPLKFNAIIVAAGSGTRLGADIPKQYIKLQGKTILQHTLEAFLNIEGLDNLCVVINPAHEGLFHDATKDLDGIKFCIGGDTRKDSVYNGLSALVNLDNADLVLVHDAARPFITPSEIYDLLSTMQDHEAASLACPIVDTLRYSDAQDLATSSVSRECLWTIQTPQAFHCGVLKRAHEQCGNKDYTDDTNLVSELGIPVKFVVGSKKNFKITLAEDLRLAEQLLSTNLPTDIRTGQGFDVHAFDDEAVGVKSIKLCGVDIAHDRKLKGHSDADVGLHALTDAILGAIGEGDIGLHFPPSNMDFKNMDSSVFLEHAIKLLRDKGGKLINADITLICERPKIGNYRVEIIKRIADILNVSITRINIKATTTEQLGFTGRKEGIAAQAAVSVSLPTLDY